MFGKGPFVSSVVWIPQSDRCVSAPAGKRCTIWTESNDFNDIGMSSERFFRVSKSSHSTTESSDLHFHLQALFHRD